MSKLTSLLLFLAITGCATTPTNRESALRIDATSLAAFQTSVAAMQHRLRPDFQLRFVAALQEVWSATALKAGSESSEDEITQRYFTQLNGLGYEQVVGLGGPAAELKYNALVAQVYAREARERAERTNPGFAGFPDSSSGMVGTNNSGVYTGQTPAWSAY